MDKGLELEYLRGKCSALEDENESLKKELTTLRNIVGYHISQPRKEFERYDTRN